MVYLKAVKKLAVSGTLILLLLLPLAMQMVYFFQEYRVKEIMEECIGSALVTESMVLTTAKYEEVRIGNHEIFWKGKMYDIKSVSHSAGKVSLELVADHREDAIHLKIKLADKNNSRKDSKGSAIGMHWVVIDFVIPGWSANFFHSLVSITFFQNNTLMPSSGYQGIVVPPPWFS